MAIIKGTKLSERLNGGMDADSIYGLGGNDILDGGAGNDKLIGAAGDDILDGGLGIDILTGSGGNDQLLGGDGNDDLRGGGGNDTADGGADNDKITGGGGNDTLSGGDGNDRILGDYGNDTINGDAGDDVLYGLDQNDTLNGGADADYLNGGAGDDILNGGTGNDRIYGITGNDTIDGGDGDDIVSGGIGDDIVSGGEGNDLMIGEVGNDVLYGNAGDDNIYAGFGSDQAYGGDGNDYIFGDDDNDTLVGGSGADELDGGNGNDILEGGAGNDLIIGNAGTDTAVFSGNLSDYDFVFIGTDILVTHARGSQTDGTDTVRGSVEQFRFADVTISRPDPGADDYDVTAPTDSNAADNLVMENSATGTAVGLTAYARDLDITNNTITYSLTDNGGGLFQINSTTGVVTTAAAINREAVGASVNITVQAASSDGSVATQTFTIAIGDVDEFDVGSVSDANTAANTVTENAAVGTVVGITASASDADATNNTITYSLTNDAGGLFQVDASTGVVTVLGAIDREAVGATASITVRATSSDGSFSSQTFSIAVADVNEFAVSTPVDSNAAANAVNENVAAGTAVGITAFASDADATTNAITYSLVDNAGGLFQINATTGVVTTLGAIDYETTGPSKDITVRATSADGSTADQTFTITINNVNDAPVVTSAATADATQISFTASDVDVGDSLSIASPFSSIFPGAVNNGSMTTLTVAEQASATSGTLSVRDSSGSTAALIGLVLGSSAANTITAAIAGSPNALYGFGGNDTITGSTAADFLIGGAGNDTMTGGSGVDTFYVDSGTDTITDLGTGGSDNVVLSAGATATITATAAWTASASTSNAGTASITTNGFSINVASATGSNGWTISNSASSTGVTITGSANADTLTGGSGIDTIYGGAGADTVNGGAEGDTIYGGDGADTINVGVSNDNKADKVVYTATSEFGDTVSNFDVDGTVDIVRFTSALNTEYDDVTNNDTFSWASGNGTTATGVTANIGSVEGLYLGGSNGEGVTNANLTSASAVAAAFNAEFAISGSGDAVLVINDTDANSFAVWIYTEVSGSEIDQSELTLVGVFSANATVTTSSFGFA